MYHINASWRKLGHFLYVGEGGRGSSPFHSFWAWLVFNNCPHFTIVSQFTHLFTHLYLKSTHRDTTLMRGFSTLVKKLSGRFPVTCHWPREAPEHPFALHTILLSVPPHPKLYCNVPPSNFIVPQQNVYCVMYTKPYHSGLYQTKPYLRCLWSGAR